MNVTPSTGLISNNISLQTIQTSVPQTMPSMEEFKNYPLPKKYKMCCELFTENTNLKATLLHNNTENNILRNDNNKILGLNYTLLNENTQLKLKIESSEPQMQNQNKFNKSIKKLRQEYSDLQKKISEQSNSINELIFDVIEQNDKIEALKKSNEDLTNKVMKQNDKIEAINKNEVELTTEIMDHDDRINALQNSINELKHVMNR
jgi:chromosome segregation ATPase